MSETNEEVITKTRLEVAEIKGMIQQYLSSTEIRLNRVENVITTHETRLDEKKGQIATLTSRADGADRAIKILEADNGSRTGKIVAILAIIISAATLILAISNRITFS